MSKDIRILPKGNYDEVQKISIDVYNANQYILPNAIKKSNRVYGNLEITEIKNMVDNAYYQPLHTDSTELNYMMYSRAMRVVRREFSKQNCREIFWKRAVENLYKRINFLQLNIEFLQDDITESEFEKIIDADEANYVISFAEIRNNLEAEAIHDIVRALGRSFDIHEITELFGVEPESLYRLQTEKLSEGSSEADSFKDNKLTSGN